MANYKPIQLQTGKHIKKETKNSIIDNINNFNNKADEVFSGTTVTHINSYSKRLFEKMYRLYSEENIINASDKPMLVELSNAYGIVLECTKHLKREMLDSSKEIIKMRKDNLELIIKLSNSLGISALVRSKSIQNIIESEESDVSNKQLGEMLKQMIGGE